MSFNGSSLNNFTTSYYKPGQAFGVYTNKIPSLNFFNQTVAVEYTITDSSGALIGYLNASSGQMAWYFVQGGLALFQDAQIGFQAVTFTHGSWTVTKSLCPVIDNGTSP